MRSDSLRRATSVVKLLAVTAACVFLALFLRRGPQPAGELPGEVTVKCDTITIRDTIFVAMPGATETKNLGFRKITLPVWRPRTESATSESRCEADEAAAEGEEESEPPDSATVSLPIEQRHYRGEEYEAWVSGWNPSLDSLRVYATATTVTRREMEGTKRWHLGVTAGYGYTPQGFQPYIGIGISYSLFSWK